MCAKILLLVLGTGSGLAVSQGVFTVFTAVGIVPRFADKTSSAHYVLLYEDMIIWGTFVGMLVSVFYPYAMQFRLGLGMQPSSRFGLQSGLETGLRLESAIYWMQNLLLTIYGLFTGAYIGCLALSIAEIYDAIPIMTRRIHLRRGLGFMILSFALGKLVGGLIFTSMIAPL